MTSSAMVVSSDGGRSAALLSPDVGVLSTDSTNQAAPPMPQPAAGSAVSYNNRSSVINDGGDSNKKKLPQMECETRIHPPKDGIAYSKEEVQTLGKVFDSRDIGKAIEASGYGPSAATVRRHLQPIYIVYPQRPEDREKVDAMIESTKESRAASANMKVDAPLAATNNVSTNGNSRRTNTTMQDVDRSTTSTPIAISKKTSRSEEEEQQQRNTKRTKVDTISQAAKILAPRHDLSSEWKLSLPSDKPTSPSTITEDANQLEVMLHAISRGDASRAASDLRLVLSRKPNATLKEAILPIFKEMICKKGDKEQADVILNSIKQCIAHHTNSKGGTRTTAAETLVKDSVLACVFGDTNEDGSHITITNSALSKLIGTTNNQVASARTRMKDILTNDSIVTKLERKTRKDFIRVDLREYVFDFLLDDIYTRLDTKQGLVEAIDPRTDERITVHKRIWLNVNKRQQLSLFLSSDHFARFQAKHNGATVGYDVWSDVLGTVGTFVSNPLHESCVDEKISGLEHIMAALLGVLKRNDVKEDLEKYDGDGLKYDELYDVTRKAGAHPMVEAVCCDKEEVPELHIDKEKPCPKFIPLHCTHNGYGKPRCTCCGVEKSLGILESLTSPDSQVAEEVVEVMMWEDARRQGKSNGKDNTQRELTSKHMTVKNLVAEFKKQLNTCIPHVQEIQRIRHLMDTDFTRLAKGCLLILTDFSAVMCLRAFQVKNSSVDGHASNANFVCIWNRREVSYTESKKDGDVVMETNETTQIFTVDVHHFFAETFSKGKGGNHAMHNACIDKLITHYKKRFMEELGIPLTSVIYWTDNAPHQYRCRQCFVWDAMLKARHPDLEKITHRLAVVDNFKGNHDAVGKGPAHLVRTLELMGIRSPNAFMVFVNCMERLEQTPAQTMWKEYEKNGDAHIKNKGVYGMDSRTVWFVVETLDEFNTLSAKYPGRIVFVNRSFTFDTHNAKSFNGTTDFHEVCSTAAVVQTAHPRKYSLEHAIGLAIVSSVR